MRLKTKAKRKAGKIPLIEQHKIRAKGHFYDAEIKKIVVNFAEKTDNKEARRKYGISEATIRRWRAKSVRSLRIPIPLLQPKENVVKETLAKKPRKSDLDSMPLEQRLRSPSTSTVLPPEPTEPVLHSQPLSPTKLKVTRQAKPSLPSPKPPSPPPPPPPIEEVCLKWNSHHSNMQNTFPSLLLREQYVDATLVAEGQTLKCHRVILSSCSPYFEDVLASISPYQHPVLFMKDVPFWILKSLCDFMYSGEVHIVQTKLEELLAVAEMLKIKGLAGQTQAKTPAIIKPDPVIVKEEIIEEPPKKEEIELSKKIEKQIKKKEEKEIQKKDEKVTKKKEEKEIKKKEEKDIKKKEEKEIKKKEEKEVKKKEDKEIKTKGANEIKRKDETDTKKKEELVKKKEEKEVKKKDEKDIKKKDEKEIKPVEVKQPKRKEDKELKQRDEKIIKEIKERKRAQAALHPEMPILKRSVKLPLQLSQIPALKYPKAARKRAEKKAVEKETVEKVPIPKDLNLKKNILDPLDLLEPVYEEVAKDPKPTKPIIPKEPKTMAVRQKRIKKRKISDLREDSPPPVLSRKGTRSRPNRKVPKYFHPPDEISTIVREPHTDQADPLMHQLQCIKSELVYDDAEDSIEIEDNLVGFSESSMSVEESLIESYDQSSFSSYSRRTTRRSQKEMQPIIMDVHSIANNQEGNTVKIINVADLKKLSDPLEDPLTLNQSSPTVLEPIDNPLGFRISEVITEKEDSQSSEVCQAMGFKITNITSEQEVLQKKDGIKEEEEEAMFTDFDESASQENLTRTNMLLAENEECLPSSTTTEMLEDDSEPIDIKPVILPSTSFQISTTQQVTEQFEAPNQNSYQEIIGEESDLRVNATEYYPETVTTETTTVQEPMDTSEDLQADTLAPTSFRADTTQDMRVFTEPQPSNLEEEPSNTEDLVNKDLENPQTSGDDILTETQESEEPTIKPHADGLSEVGEHNAKEIDILLDQEDDGNYDLKDEEALLNEDENSKDGETSKIEHDSNISIEDQQNETKNAYISNSSNICISTNMVENDSPEENISNILSDDFNTEENGSNLPTEDSVTHESTANLPKENIDSGTRGSDLASTEYPLQEISSNEPNDQELEVNSSNTPVEFTHESTANVPKENIDSGMSGSDLASAEYPHEEISSNEPNDKEMEVNSSNTPVEFTHESTANVPKENIDSDMSGSDLASAEYPHQEISSNEPNDQEMEVNGSNTPVEFTPESTANVSKENIDSGMSCSDLASAEYPHQEISSNEPNDQEMEVNSSNTPVEFTPESTANVSKENIDSGMSCSDLASAEYPHQEISSNEPNDQEMEVNSSHTPMGYYPAEGINSNIPIVDTGEEIGSDPPPNYVSEESSSLIPSVDMVEDISAPPPTYVAEETSSNIPNVDIVGKIDPDPPLNYIAEDGSINDDMREERRSNAPHEHYDAEECHSNIHNNDENNYMYNDDPMGDEIGSNTQPDCNVEDEPISAIPTNDIMPQETGLNPYLESVEENTSHMSNEYPPVEGTSSNLPNNELNEENRSNVRPECYGAEGCIPNLPNDNLGEENSANTSENYNLPINMEEGGEDLPTENYSTEQGDSIITSVNFAETEHEASVPNDFGTEGDDLNVPKDDCAGEEFVPNVLAEDFVLEKDETDIPHEEHIAEGSCSNVPNEDSGGEISPNAVTETCIADESGLVGMTADGMENRLSGNYVRDEDSVNVHTDKFIQSSSHILPNESYAKEGDINVMNEGYPSSSSNVLPSLYDNCEVTTPNPLENSVESHQNCVSTETSSSNAPGFHIAQVVSEQIAEIEGHRVPEQFMNDANESCEKNFNELESIVNDLSRIVGESCGEASGSIDDTNSIAESLENLLQK